MERESNQRVTVSKSMQNIFLKVKLILMPPVTGFIAAAFYSKVANYTREEALEKKFYILVTIFSVIAVIDLIYYLSLLKKQKVEQ